MLRIAINLVAVICAMLSVKDAVAQSACAAISDNDKRLQCYDQLSNPIEPIKIGDWTIETIGNPGDDYSAVLNSKDGIRCNGRNEEVRLNIQCFGNSPSIFISTECRIAGNQWAVLEALLNTDDHLVPHRFDLAKDGRSFGYFDAGSANRLIRYFLRAKELRVDFTDIRNASQSAFFDLDGVDAVLEPLVGNCIYLPKLG